VSPITKGLAQSAIQAAIYTLLSGDTGTGSLRELIGTAIYDAVPDSTTADFVAIGEWTEASDDTLEDGDNGVGSDCTVTIDIYTDDAKGSAGYKKAQTIAARVKLLLHGTALSITGWSTVTCEHEETIGMRDEDQAGRPKRHEVSTYRIGVEA
jgi:hypothetical protein